MAQKPIWKFKPLAKDDKRVDPIEQEFFTTESVGQPTDALIRETIQNSLDARSPDHEGPVRVRIFVSGKSGVAPRYYTSFFEGLEPHLQSKENDLAKFLSFKSHLSFVTIEDFGTKGLRGNPQESEDAPGENNFFYFWRNIGRSQKREDDRGRWGLGKTVFPASSKIHSFFGLTIRQGENNNGLLMGQAVLKTHRDANGTLYRPYGDFGIFESKKGAEYFSLPAEDNATVSQFRNAFKLRRTSEPGLSIVIPAPNEDLQFSGTLLSVLRQYFSPILQGDLIVELEEPDQEVVIDKNTIRSVLNEAPLQDEEKSSLLGLYTLTSWALERKEEEHYQLDWIDPKAPSWSTLLGDRDPNEFRAIFESESRIAFRIGVPVKSEESTASPSQSQFHAYLERDLSLKRGQAHFVRQGLKISAVSPSLEGNLRGLVMVYDGSLGSLLGDSENPAHTEWQPYSPKFRGKYRHGFSTLIFVKNSLRELATFLTQLRREINKDLLKEFFFLERPTEDPGESSTLKPDDDSDPEITVPPSVPLGRDPEPVKITKLHGGVRVTPDPLAGGILPTLITLRFAYRVRRGNSFKRYQLPDFDLSSTGMQIQQKAVVLHNHRENQIEFSPSSADFELTISGFDPSRDLVVSASYQMDVE